MLSDVFEKKRRLKLYCVFYSLSNCFFTFDDKYADYYSAGD